MNFTFFESYFSAISKLDDADRLACYDAICRYGVTGEEPQDLAGVAAMAFKLVKPNIDKSHARHAAGKLGGVASRKQAASKREANVKQTASKDDFASDLLQSKTQQDKEKDKDKDKDINKRFTPPSATEVADYIREKGYKIDAEAFIDFYSSKGWKVGNQPMKDWKACVRTWARREPGKIREYHNRYNDFPQRDNDYDKIQEEWIRKEFGA